MRATARRIQSGRSSNPLRSQVRQCSDMPQVALTAQLQRRDVIVAILIPSQAWHLQHFRLGASKANRTGLHTDPTTTHPSSTLSPLFTSPCCQELIYIRTPRERGACKLAARSTVAGCLRQVWSTRDHAHGRRVDGLTTLVFALQRPLFSITLLRRAAPCRSVGSSGALLGGSALRHSCLPHPLHVAIFPRKRTRPLQRSRTGTSKRRCETRETHGANSPTGAAPTDGQRHERHDNRRERDSARTLGHEDIIRWIPKDSKLRRQDDAVERYMDLWTCGCECGHVDAKIHRCE